jgi:hypothetical protein
MTDESPPSADDADSLLIEQLAQLRGMGPSRAAQDTFHRIVATELVAVRRAHSAAWWRRSIRVPVPVCIAAGLAMFALLFAQLFGATERSIRVSAPSPTAAATKPEPIRRTTSTYLLGVGDLATETHCFSMED